MSDANRLTFDDALFATMRRALDVPVVSQTVWRFDHVVDTEAAQRLHAHLARGPLNRVLVRSRVPGARDRWARGSFTRPLAVELRPLDPGRVMEWIENHAATSLDPEHGPTWSLALTGTTDGGSVLSFVTSHVVADGSLKLLALDAAARGVELPFLPDDGAHRASLRADLVDGARQLAAAGRGLVGAVRRPAPPARPARPRSGVRSAPSVVVCDLSAAEWERAAAADGGSANSLLAAVCVELLLAAGRAAPGDTVPVSMPVSTRGADDLRSNASTGVTVHVDTAARDGLGVVPSLAGVRARAKAAFATLADGTGPDPLALARAVLPLVPDALVRRLAPTWPAPVVLASNLGRLSPAVEAPFGVPASSVVNRSITHAPVPVEGGLSAWWGRTSATATLCVAAPFGRADALRTLLGSVLALRGLAPTFW